MAINDISQYFTLDNGTQIANDNTFASLAANTRIKNKNSGSTFIKNSNYSNVFDRVSTFTEFIKATDFKIATSGSGNGVASISYTASNRTVTQTLTAFATPAELTAASNNLKSQAVGSISVSGRTVTYKNINGQTLGSFQTQDNNTTYSAGTGLNLSGTQFNVRIPNVNNEYGNNNNFLMALNTAQNKCVPLDITLNRLFDYVNAKVSNSSGLIDSYSGGGYINGPANYLRVRFGNEEWLLQWFVREGSGSGNWPAGSYSRTPLAMVTASWPGSGHYAVDHSDNLSFDNTTYSFEKYERGGFATIFAFGRTN